MIMETAIFEDNGDELQRRGILSLLGHRLLNFKTPI